MPRPERFLTTANLLSLSRIPLAAAFPWALLASGAGAWGGLAVLVVAGATDALDGIAARRAAAHRAGARVGAVPTPAGTGSWLDPICDKVFVAAVLGTLWLVLRPPLVWLALILARELAQVPLALVYAAIPSLRRWLRYDFRASVLGKAATVLQFAAIATLMFRLRAAPLFAVAAFVVGVLALLDYIRRAVRLGRARLADDEPLART